ncbi:MAG: hypothetical protein KatS3mg032_0093 [Cyclobacteriaceae bacterium]|nr:MAG: hypothetical protein KatS3mg032_0093 [Cyclobacteriaceae bacterium]
MILRIFKAVWFISVAGVLANLLYVYAGWPQQVQVYQNQTGEAIWIGKEPLFYIALGGITVVNVLVYLFSQKISPNEVFRSWLHGQVITLNIFIVISVSFIGLYNSAERFDYTRVGPILYVSVALVLLWALAWPVIWAAHRMRQK